MILKRSLPIFLLVFLFSWSPAKADFESGTAIRDAEIEQILRNYLDPLFKTAGLNPKEARIIMIIEDMMNAAALPNNTLLFYTGFLMETGSAEEVAGVLAHEVGHIAGRHLVRMYGAMEQSQKIGILGALMGVAVALMGAPDAGMALALGGATQGLHSFLHYRRTEEEAADMLGVKYLQKLQWPIKGLRIFLSKLLGQELLSEALQSPYLRTHPLTTERVEMVRSKEKAQKGAKMPAYFYEQHRRMVAKLKAFLWDPGRSLETFKGTSTIDLYAQSIALYRQANFEESLKLLDTLIQREPKNPFFWEFKGQVLFDSGKVKESVQPYRHAVNLLPGSALLHVGLAQSLLRCDQDGLIEEAVEHLYKALDDERDNGMAWYYLAIAYGRQEKMAKMALALAERGVLMEKWPYAIEQSERAQHFSKKSEPDYRRAEEIKRLAVRKRAEGRRSSLF